MMKVITSSENVIYAVLFQFFRTWMFRVYAQMFTYVADHMCDWSRNYVTGNTATTNQRKIITMCSFLIEHTG